MIDLSKFEDRHPAIRSVLQFFDSAHLHPALREVAQAFEAVAEGVVTMVTADHPQLTIALQDLLRAKDAAVRAAADMHGIISGSSSGAAPEPDPRAVADTTLPTSDNALSATQSVSGVPVDPSAGNAPEASAEPAAEAAPATAPLGPGTGGVSDSGPAGVTLLSTDLPPEPPAATGAVPTTLAGTPGVDFPVTHNVDDPAQIVGSGSVTQ